MKKDVIKQLFTYYKYLPLFFWYRLTLRGWTPDEDIFFEKKQGFSYLYRRFWYHRMLLKQTVKTMNHGTHDKDLNLYIGELLSTKLLSKNEMNLAKDYEMTLTDEYEKMPWFKKKEDVK